MSPDLETSARPRRIPWLYALGWLPIVTIYLVAFITSGVPVGASVRNAVASLLPDALLGIGVLLLPRRFPWLERSRTGFFALHAGMIAGFAAASTAGWALLVGLDRLVFEGAFDPRVEPRLLPWRFLTDMLIYGTVAGVSYAWHNSVAIREQAGRAARAEALRARAEMEALRSQLNPHFILNTFHSLLGLLRREPAVAEEALERLGDLLRYSLRVQREALDEVTLREEMDFVRGFLDLERLRLGDRLRMSVEAMPGTLDSLVPSFALQTLVENAIRHAIAPSAAGGSLSLRASHAEGRLRIEVEDTTEGSRRPASPAEGGGVGLRLLRERLAALYDGKASLSLHAGSTGTRAVLDLPDRRLAGSPE